jgi:hypothetical protein
VKRLLLMFAVLGTVVYVGCKQSDGERCQVDEDCESGLCNMAKGTCASGTNTEEIDASVPDGPPPDAAVDAPPDAP